MTKHEKVLLQKHLNSTKAYFEIVRALGNYILANAQSVCISHRTE